MKLLYFAWVRQFVGKAEETFTLPADVGTVAQLAQRLAVRGDGYAQAFADPARLRAAVNHNHVDFESPIRDEDEIAFFPPVTGG
jgi:molybdopterin synthase sulfur carrier subunit